ncbi:MAG: helix-turn-helix domain-containing protein [Flavobacteriaceae bacterium]
MYLSTVPDWFINLGFAAHYVTAPALFLYLYFTLHSSKWKVINLLHFLPAMVLLVFLFKVNEANFWYKGGYTFLLYHQLIYTLLTMALFILKFKKRNAHLSMISKEIWLWLGLLIIGASAIQLAYFSNYILGLTPYLGGPLIYAVFIYVISLYAFSHQKVFDKYPNGTKYGNISLSREQLELSMQRITTIMEYQKPYLQDSFNLERLAKLTSLPPYLTSYVINKGFKTSFSDYSNAFRIKEAQSKLRSPSYDHIKIAEIAYECGFSSLSSFNIAFKKHCSATPSSFRKNGR